MSSPWQGCHGRIAALLVLLAVTLASQARAEETRVQFGRLGQVALQEPEGPPRELVLFLSGDGGWNQGVVAMARHLADQGALVAGIDINHYGSELNRTRDACVFASGDLEDFAHFIEKRHHFPDYVRPVLVGYSSGATLAYVALAQSPHGTFKGAMSLGFCPTVAWSKPPCRGNGPGLASVPARGSSRGHRLQPAAGLQAPWIVLQGGQDQVCAAAVTRNFTASMPAAQLVSLPKVGHGFAVEKNYLAEFRAAFERLAATGSGPASDAAPGIPDLPLVEVPATGTPRKVFAIMLSGDGGWAGLDREVAAILAKNGVPVVGWDSLRYFWTARTPEDTGRDLGRIISHYSAVWRTPRVIVIGYSLGASAMPFLVNRLPPALRRQVALTALLAPGREAVFEFHVTLWLGARGHGLPLAPELARWNAGPVLCLYGAEEPDSLCPTLGQGPYRLARLPGGHHFNGDYGTLAERILDALPPGS